MGIIRRPVAGIVPALAALDADELSRPRQQREAHLRQLVQMGAKPLLLRLDAPVVILPQMDVQFIAAANGDLPLLEALAPSVRCLTGDKLLQRGQLHRGKLIPELTLRHTPKLPAAQLRAECNGAYLVVYSIRLIVPIHEAAGDLLRHPVLHKGTADVILILNQLPSRQQLRFVRHIAPFVPLIEVSGEGHI